MNHEFEATDPYFDRDLKLTEILIDEEAYCQRLLTALYNGDVQAIDMAHDIITNEQNVRALTALAIRQELL